MVQATSSGTSFVKGAECLGWWCCCCCWWWWWWWWWGWWWWWWWWCSLQQGISYNRGSLLSLLRFLLLCVVVSSSYTFSLWLLLLVFFLCCGCCCCRHCWCAWGRWGWGGPGDPKKTKKYVPLRNCNFRKCVKHVALCLSTLLRQVTIGMSRILWTANGTCRTIPELCKSVMAKNQQKSWDQQNLKSRKSYTFHTYESELDWVHSDTCKGGQKTHKHTYVSHVRMIPRNPDAILTTMLTSLRFFTGIGPMQQKQVENIHMYAYLCTLLSWGFKYICY